MKFKHYGIILQAIPIHLQILGIELHVPIIILKTKTQAWLQNAAILKHGPILFQNIYFFFIFKYNYNNINMKVLSKKY